MPQSEDEVTPAIIDNIAKEITKIIKNTSQRKSSRFTILTAVVCDLIEDAFPSDTASQIKTAEFLHNLTVKFLNDRSNFYRNTE